jgi:type IV secretory pathway TraG/TraD family ATPase VirD4
MNTPLWHFRNNLGTAAWGESDGKVIKSYDDGQFLVGLQDSGEEVGLRDDQHGLIVAGPRGGKGIALLIPNLITYPGSVVVIDPKGENAMVTARRRGGGNQFTAGMNQKVVLLDPMREVTTRFDDFDDIRGAFNPLSLLKASRPESIDDAARIADGFIYGENLNDPYWNNAAKDLLVALMLHIATSPDFTDNERTLAKVFDLLLAGQSDASEAVTALDDKKKPSALQLLFMAMTRNRAFDGLVARYGRSFLNLASTSAKQFNSVLGVLVAALNFLRSPNMRACVSKSTFALHELKTLARGLSLYVCLPQRDLNTHYGWLRMMVSLITAEMERVKEQPATGHRLLMILDEFPALKRMAVLENAAAQIAGFGVKLIFVVQTLAQLKDIYKDNWETFVGTCGVKLFFCNDDHFTREYVSKLIGEHEIIRTSVSTSVTSGSNRNEGRNEGESRTWGSSVQKTPGREDTKSKSSSAGRSWSRSESKGWSESTTRGTTYSVHKRALLTPDEVGREFGDRGDPRVLVLLSGRQPIALRRRYYFDKIGFAGFYDCHRDHPVPYTKVEAKQLREEHKRNALAQAEAQRRKAEEEHRLRQQMAWAEAAARAERELQAARRREKNERRRITRIWIACALGAVVLTGLLVVLYFYWKIVLVMAAILIWLAVSMIPKAE